MTNKTGMSPEAKEARNAYLRAWRKKNPSKVQRHIQSYWQKQAEKMEQSEEIEEVKE